MTSVLKHLGKHALSAISFEMHPKNGEMMDYMIKQV